MKQLVSILVILALLLSTTLVYADPEAEHSTNLTEQLQLSTPTIQQTTYSSVALAEATSYTSDTDYKLPAITKTYTYPLGTTIEDIQITFNDATTQQLTTPLEPASTTLRDDGTALSTDYERTIPENGYTTTLVGARDGDELVTKLILKLYPTTYEDSTQTLTTYNTIDISFTTTPTTPHILADTYDLLIITPPQWKNTLQTLVEHKESIGITTKLVTLDEIYDSTYFTTQGRDEAEQVKYFIRDALDTWGIEYVLLVGGRSGGLQQEKWDVPVRYSNLYSQSEPTFLSDLYFSCIYDEGGNFSTWDPDGDGIYAEWRGVSNKEIIDLYPEVAVGRLACRTKLEVKTMVNKIITYETTASGSDWAKHFIGISGDTYPDTNDPYYEGELATQGSYSYLQSLGYTSDFIWTSTGTFTGPEDVYEAFSSGAGLVHFSGHGNPAAWSNHPPNDDGTWIDGPRSFDMYRFNNKDAYPIIVVGGCHNAQFNVSIINIFKGILNDGLLTYFGTNPVGDFWHMEWVPWCWSWSLINKASGGGIASIANTGYGYGIPGEDWESGRGRWVEMKFFESVANGNETLGQAYNAHLSAFLDTFPPFDDVIDTKIAEQWVLFGDPSLQIGGV